MTDEYDDKSQTPDQELGQAEEQPGPIPQPARPKRKPAGAADSADKEDRPRRSKRAAPAEPEESRPRRKAAAPQKARADQAKSAKADKTRSIKKKPPKIDRGKWRDGTPRQRLQRIIWLLYQVYRFAPAWLIVLILLAILVPSLVRMTKRPTAIAPFYTPEVQYWAPQIAKWSGQYDVNPDLIATLMQIESCGYPGAASNVGAQGLFQVMPMHFASTENMTDPETNALRGIGVIKECLNYASGDIGLAMACYNGGPGLISRDPSNWPTESQHYYTWGVGIYNDAVTGKTSSPTLQDWLQAGGAGLCAKAAVVLGLPSPTEGVYIAPPTAVLPTPTPLLPTVSVEPHRVPTEPPFSGNESTLPTFSLGPTNTPTSRARSGPSAGP